MKISDFRNAVISKLTERVELERSQGERNKGYVYEAAADIELIENLLSAAEKTTEEMSDRLYKSVQYSLSKFFKTIQLQAKTLGETKAYTNGRKDSIVYCKEVCHKEYKRLAEKEQK